MLLIYKSNDIDLLSDTKVSIKCDVLFLTHFESNDYCYFSSMFVLFEV